jgi:hypothetical protein
VERGMAAHVQQIGSPGVRGALTGRAHTIGLTIFTIVVLGHWAEHVTQAVQIWVLDWPRPKAKGVLGLVWPWLITSEWLHYGFAIVMLIGFIALRKGFTGNARKWWNLALWIQVWHHLEHLLLLIQAITGSYLLGKKAPTSLAQLVFPRVELHLFYNAIVFIPMVVAVCIHMKQRSEQAELRSV